MLSSVLYELDTENLKVETATYTEFCYYSSTDDSNRIG